MIKPDHNYSSPLTLMQDADEGRYIMPFVAGIVTNQHRSDYADWLAEREPTRAELLKLQYLLSQPDLSPAQTVQLQSRYKEQRRQLNGFHLWLKVVELGLEVIFKCNAADIDPELIKYRFKCPNDWILLKLTDKAEVRYCEQCSQNVYLCSSRDQVIEHAQNNHCIAIPHKLTSEMMHEIPCTITGQVDLHGLLEEKLYKDSQK